MSLHVTRLCCVRQVCRDDEDMNAGRVTLIISCLVVAGLGVWFVVARWDQANKVASAVSALAALAAVGVAIWAALRPAQSRRALTVSDTGRATAHDGGRAITGVSGKASDVDGPVRVERTGDAKVSGNGDAITGAQLD